MPARKLGPRVLFYDIETAPIIAYAWALFDQNIALNQIHTDWHVISWAAKWMGEEKIHYMDQRGVKNIEDDGRILKGIWKLLDEADVVVTQNGKRFDQKKLYARFILNGMKPPSPSKHIDTLQIAKKHFAFTSNKLEYMSDKLCAKNKKLKTKEFVGFELWKECLAGNKKAWRELELYNRGDVLALEELYEKLIPWDKGVDFNLYRDGNTFACKCGSVNYQKRGFALTSTGKHQIHQCNDCGAYFRDQANILQPQKRRSLKRFL